MSCGAGGCGGGVGINRGLFNGGLGNGLGGGLSGNGGVTPFWGNSGPLNNGFSNTGSLGGKGCCIKELCPAVACNISDIAKELTSGQCGGGVPGLSIGIIVGGKVAFTGSFGQRSECPSDVLTTNSRWQFYSLSEVFLAVALAECMSNGLACPQQLLSDFIPVRQPGLACATLGEVAARYTTYRFYNYVWWASLVGCVPVCHIINTMGTKNLQKLTTNVFGQTIGHIADHEEYFPSLVSQVLRCYCLPLAGGDPLDDVLDQPACLSQEQFVEYLRTHFGFTSLSIETDVFKQDSNAVWPLFRKVCEGNGCDPCAPCNSCCVKKSNCVDWVNRYLVCQEVHCAWNLSGTLHDLLRALQIMLSEGLPEEFGCKNRAYPDPCKPYFCAAAFTQMFTGRYNWVLRDCNSVPTNTMVGMLWYGARLCGNTLWYLDSFDQAGSTQIAAIDRERCLGIVVLTNTLSAVPHALVAYIYTLILTQCCDLARAEYDRVFNMWNTFILNNRCCQPSLISNSALNNGGAWSLTPSNYSFGVLHAKITCVDGVTFLQIGRCGPAARLCLTAPGLWTATVTLSDGRRRLAQVSSAQGAAGAHYRIFITVECETFEFYMNNYEPVNQGIGMECCRGVVDRFLSTEPQPCSMTPPSTVILDSLPPRARYNYGGDVNNITAAESALCLPCNQYTPPGTTCEPCPNTAILGDPYLTGGITNGLDPNGVYNDSNTVCPRPIGFGSPYGCGGVGVYPGVGGCGVGGVGGGAGFFPGVGVGGGGGCATGSCGKRF